MTTAPIGVSVRNVLGCRDVDLVLTPQRRIALIGGLHGQGKSSVVDAVRACLLGKMAMRDVTTAKEAGLLVNRSADKGHVRIDIAGPNPSTKRLSVPSGEVYTEGPNPASGDKVAIGAVPFANLTDKERARLLVDLLQAEPDREDIAEGVLKAGFKEPDGTASEKTISGVLAMLEAASGNWDVAFSTLRETTAKRKAEWFATTGQNWGAKVAIDWRPHGLVDQELVTCPIELLTQEAEDARIALEHKIGGQAYDAGTLVAKKQQMEEKAAEGLLLEGHQGKVDTIEARIAEIDEKLPALRAAVAEKSAYKCPHCEAHIQVLQINPGVWNILPAEEPPYVLKADLDAMRTQVAKLDGERARIQGELSAAKAAVISAKLARQKAGELTAEINRMEAHTGDSKPVDIARDKHAVAARRLEQRQKIDAANLLHRKIDANNRILEHVFDPETGVRATKLKKRLIEMNDLLRSFCTTMKIEPVEIDQEGEISMGGRSFRLLNKAAKYYVQIVFQLAVAHHRRPTIVVIDDLDQLLPPYRGAIIGAIFKMNIPAIVAMACTGMEPPSEDRPSGLPHLEKMGKDGIGVTYWAEAGSVIPVAEAIKQKQNARASA